MLEIMKRVAVWNQKRCEQEFNQSLFLEMIREEHREWLDADLDVSKLDALCDKIFVCFGAVWKAKIDLAELDDAMEVANTMVTNIVNSVNLWPGYLDAAFIDAYEKDQYSLAALVATTTTICMTEIAGLGLSREQALKALNIVCDSNDSKSISKISSDAKYSSEGKGAYFIPPEHRLQALLNESLN